MKRSIGDFQVPVDSLTVFFVEAILVTLVIYDHFLIQLRRKWKGKPGKNLISGSPMEVNTKHCSVLFSMVHVIIFRMRVKKLCHLNCLLSFLPSNSIITQPPASFSQLFH